MGPSLLTRRCVGECLRQLAFYLAAYLALISIAVTAPLIRGGAPLGAVIAFLPDQMALPATLALPLALVTAILVTLGRMRDDGEMIALQAAGISPLRTVLALLPLALVTGLAVGLMAHAVLPESFQRWREGKSALLRQAVATKVARRSFIYEDDRGTALAADDVDGGRLIGLYARHHTEAGDHLMMFAPRARWIASSDRDRDSVSLHLELEGARLLGTERGDDGATTVTGGAFPSLVLRMEQSNPVWTSKADTKSTATLERDIAAYAKALDLLDQSDELPAFLAGILASDPVLRSEDVASWPRLLDRLRDPGDVPLLRSLALELGDLLPAAERDPSARARLRAALAAALPATMAVPSVVAALPPPLRPLAQREKLRPALSRFALDLAVERSVAPAPSTVVVDHALTSWRNRGEHWRRQTRLDLQEDLRVHQMAWHLRWLMAVLPLGYWLFAAGLALALPASNRLFAVCLALGTVLATLLPGVALAKNSEGHLGFDPGWVMWGSLVVLVGGGGWLCWSRR